MKRHDLLQEHRDRPNRRESNCALTRILAQFHIPVGQIDEVLPTVVLVQSQIDLDERTPLGPFRLPNKMHAGLQWRAIGLACITANAGADNILPGRRAATVTRNHMIKIQIFAVK